MSVATIVRGPYLFNQSNTGITIFWVTDLGRGPNAIQYSYPGSATITQLALTTQIQDDATGEVFFAHTVDLKDLPEDTLFNYNIQAEDFLSSTVYTFKTYASSSSVSLGVWGNNSGSFGNSVPGLGATVTGIGSVDAYLCTGGVVEDFTSYSDWTDGFYGGVGSSLTSTPLLASRSKSEPLGGLGRSLYPVPAYGTWRLGPIQVVSLDTTPNLGVRSLRPGNRQHEWFTQVATNSPSWKSASYRVIIAHNAPKTNFWSPDKSFGNGNGLDVDLDNVLTPLIELSGADLCLFGMSKSYQRGSMESTRPGNPGNSLYVITGGGGGFKHNVQVADWGPPRSPNIVEESSDYHYLSVLADTSSLEVTANSLESVTVLDSFSIAPRILL